MGPGASSMRLDFFWFQMLVLTKHGYNATTGTTLIQEHGKANADKTGKFGELLTKVTGGAVRLDASGIWGAPEFKAMLFEGRPTGNFKYKAPIESVFNLVRNYRGGAAGADRTQPRPGSGRKLRPARGKHAHPEIDRPTADRSFHAAETPGCGVGRLLPAAPARDAAINIGAITSSRAGTSSGSPARVIGSGTTSRGSTSWITRRSPPASARFTIGSSRSRGTTSFSS
jgi:hypothetical protein